MQIIIDINEDIVQGIIDGKNDAPRNIVRAFQATIADAIKNGTPLLPKDSKCRWIHYDYRTICLEEHDVNNPYWMIPENRMDALKYCPYCGREIEIEVESEVEER